MDKQKNVFVRMAGNRSGKSRECKETWVGSWRSDLLSPRVRLWLGLCPPRLAGLSNESETITESSQTQSLAHISYNPPQCAKLLILPTRGMGRQMSSYWSGWKSK